MLEKLRRKWLSVAEVAAELNVSDQSVYNIIFRGELEHARFGRSYRIARDVLDKYLEKAICPARKTQK